MAINAVRLLRNKGIAVDCSDEEEAQKLILVIQGNQRLAETIECKKPSTRHPRCIIYDIPNGIADVEVLEVLELTIEAPKDSLKPSFRIKGRGDCSHLDTSAFGGASSANAMGTSRQNVCHRSITVLIVAMSIKLNTAETTWNRALTAMKKIRRKVHDSTSTIRPHIIDVPHI
ncbi:hypothetical protein HNY73_022775 [Argiope bruennichi]|uniref:Uncharacterized protein n=1 Tax=Argiope bruennichi TaxID=94029 RepID=A0A8T0E3G8_ARGBR|nr:hypothetical protein HNY73_022775 [Argiope bruennichi]